MIICSVVDDGSERSLLDIECNISNGLPNVIIVGYAGKSLDEAKERLRGAFANSKIDFPKKRVTINLAPADIPKEGSSYDLAIAAAIIQKINFENESSNEKYIFLGELGLSGKVRSIRGIIGKLIAGKQLGVNTFFIPAGNLKQAMLVPDITVFPVSNLKELYLHLTMTIRIKALSTSKDSLLNLITKNIDDEFSQVIGQPQAKRALEIAAAGQHNVLLNGPPGTGKSMLAKALPSILPNMNYNEILETTHVHSLASKNYDQIIIKRPFRSPHHSASLTSIVGGGQKPKPGEISLSHNGVLFFDELPEFSRSVIEGLRQPLEDRVITITRARDSISFPANFIFIATANPCPCGYYGTSKECSCTAYQISKYQNKLSGPILDRIDIHIHVNDVDHSKLLNESQEESSSSIAKRIENARKIQKDRFKNTTKVNSSMTNKDIKKYLNITPKARATLDKASSGLKLSARAYMKILRISRTIADLEELHEVNEIHVTEAVQYRNKTIV